jgi:DNA-binding MarR family transcriptional regulator
MSQRNNVLRLEKAQGGLRKSRAGANPGLALETLTKFRLVINSTKRHYKWIEQQTGVNGALVWALWELHQSPGLKVSEIADAMAIHQSTASNLLDKLQDKGLIKRDRSAEDQRVVRLFLTRAGKSLISRVPQPARGLLQEALIKLPPESLQSLNHLLEQLLREMNPAGIRTPRKPLAESMSS